MITIDLIRLRNLEIAASLFTATDCFSFLDFFFFATIYIPPFFYLLSDISKHLSIPSPICYNIAKRRLL